MNALALLILLPGVMPPQAPPLPAPPAAEKQAAKPKAKAKAKPFGKVCGCPYGYKCGCKPKRWVYDPKKYYPAYGKWVGGCKCGAAEGTDYKTGCRCTKCPGKAKAKVKTRRARRVTRPAYYPQRSFSPPAFFRRGGGSGC